MAHSVLMPRQGQSVESCVLVDWLVQPGDPVEEGEVLANIETDKAVFELESPASGEVLELFFKAGDDIPVLTPIAAIGESGEDVSALRPDSADVPAGSSGIEASQPSMQDVESRGMDDTRIPAGIEKVLSPQPAGGPAGTSPRAKTLAFRENVSLSGARGSGPGGRVIEQDVRRMMEESASFRPSMSQPNRLAAQSAVGEEGDIIPVKGIRKIIAERMLESLTSTAQLTMSRSFDARGVQAYRKLVKNRMKDMNLPNITINDLIVFVVSRTLKKYPELNAHFLGDEIRRYEGVNLGIAVDTERGLMVPVVRNAGNESLKNICTTIKRLADDCVGGKITPDKMTGGTFTITNLGALGIETFTPVLNPPEVAILGVGALFLKPVASEDGIDHVPSINLSLTMDHQAVDGAPAARFLKDLADNLENLELTLMG